MEEGRSREEGVEEGGGVEAEVRVEAAEAGGRRADMGEEGPVVRLLDLSRAVESRPAEGIPGECVASH